MVLTAMKVDPAVFELTSSSISSFPSSSTYLIYLLENNSDIYVLPIIILAKSTYFQFQVRTSKKATLGSY